MLTPEVKSFKGRGRKWREGKGTILKLTRFALAQWFSNLGYHSLDISLSHLSHGEVAKSFLDRIHRNSDSGGESGWGL